MVRSSLVVFQFSISILLIICTIAVNRQLGFIQNKKIGFNKDQIIVIKDAYGMGNQLQSFKETMLKDSRILSGTISGLCKVITCACIHAEQIIIEENRKIFFIVWNGLDS